MYVYTYGSVTYGWSSPKMAITGIDARKDTCSLWNPVHGGMTIQACGGLNLFLMSSEFIYIYISIYNSVCF